MGSATAGDIARGPVACHSGNEFRAVIVTTQAETTDAEILAKQGLEEITHGDDGEPCHACHSSWYWAVAGIARRPEPESYLCGLGARVPSWRNTQNKQGNNWHSDIQIQVTLCAPDLTTSSQNTPKPVLSVSCHTVSTTIAFSCQHRSGPQPLRRRRHSLRSLGVCASVDVRKTGQAVAP
jgi:hypothetical protein